MAPAVANFDEEHHVRPNHQTVATVSTELPYRFGWAVHKRVCGLLAVEASLVVDGGDLAARVLIEEAVDLGDQFRSQLQN